MSKALQAWTKLKAPNYILAILSGYRIPFITAPPLYRFTKTSCQRYQTAQSPGMSYEINKMLQSGAIRLCKSESGLLSPLFLRRKSDGSNRPIFDLRYLNNYLQPPKFRLLNHFKVPLCLNPFDFMTKIDLSQAYFHIPITEGHRRFLAFAYKDNIYEMTCLPFGLATAPCTFANISNWLANYFREEGIRIIVYLDDFLIINTNPEILRHQTDYVLSRLVELGWCINIEKSIVIPTQTIEYLGLIWNTAQNIKCLPMPKIEKITTLLHKTLRKNWWSWHIAKTILGNINFASFVVPMGKLHCRPIQIEANMLPENAKNKKFQLPQPVIKELQWWLENVNTPSPIHHKDPTIFITTDASNQGWGATVNDTHISGTWSKEQLSWHSNLKELWTLQKAIEMLIPDHQGRTILAQTDNKTVAAYINKEGGTKSSTLLQLTTAILQEAHRNKLHLIVRYLPGRYNQLADSLSRFQQMPEWTLSSQILKVIFDKLGTPTIDLFASSQSAVVDQYVSEDARDPDCAFVNAFSKPWHYQLGWLFPPPPLIPRVLRHLEKSSGKFLLVAPKWEKTFWKAELRQRALCPPLTIYNLHRHLVDLRTGKPPPAVETLDLQVWKVRAGPV